VLSHEVEGADEILLGLFAPLDPHIRYDLLELLAELLIDGRVLRVLVKIVVLDHKVFAEGSLLLGIVNHQLVIACRDYSCEDEEVKVIHVVRREVWQVY